MTLEEFESCKLSLTCSSCGRVGLEAYHELNNGGVRPHCPACGSKRPIPGVLYMRKSSKVRRPVNPNEPSTDEVWEEQGRTCAFCGLTWEETELLGIGRQKQHIHPVRDGGLYGPIVPFCARCQEMSLGAQQATWRWRKHMETLEDTIAHLQERQAELDEERNGKPH